MNTEELRIVLLTIADTSGAVRTQDALQGVQREAAQTGRAAASASAGMGSGLNVTTQSMLRLAGALGLATSAYDILANAVRSAIDLVGKSAQQFVESERLVRATSAAYGSLATDWIRFAERMATATGFSRDAILQAALSARTLSENYQLSIEQTRRLIQVSANLAQIRGIGIAEAFERIQSAIRGEAEASEYLGLTLNDTFLKNVAFNGSLRNTFETMTDVQKAQLRYTELLRQTQAFEGLAASSADTLEGAQRRTARASEDFSRVLGGLLAPALKDVANAQSEAIDSLTDWLRIWRQVPTPQELRNRAFEIERSLPVIGPQPVAPVPSELIPLGTQAQSGIEELNKSLQRLGINVQRNLVDLWRIVPEGPLQADAAIRRLIADMELFGQRSQQLGQILQALPIGDVLARAALAAEQSLQRIDAAVTARLVAAERLRRARELEQGATRILDPRDAAGAEVARARLVLVRDLENAQRELLEAQQAQTELQRQSAALAAQEAAVKLQTLPAQQRLADLQRDIAEQQARARLAALPATEALEDLRYEQERARLVASNRRASVEERVAARQRLRELGRQEPAAALAALEAERRQVPLRRAAERTSIETQLTDIASQRLLTPLERERQRLELLGQIAAALVEQRERRVEIVIQHAIDVTVGGAGVAQLTDEQIQGVADNAREQVVAAVHAARIEAERAAGQSLSLGGRG